MSPTSSILTHDWIWNAIDALARHNELSSSGLARLAGLDPTAFNPSKRFTPEGRPDIQTPPQNFRSEFLEKHYLSKE